MRTLSFALLAILPLAGCDNKDKEVKLAPTASALATSTVPVTATSRIAKYAIDPKGTTAVDMEAPKERIKASTDGAAGSIDVDLMNLANTRGEVKVDLTTLTTKTFEDKGKNESQTEHARTWLEVASKLPDDVKVPNRYAVFAIRGVEGLSQADVAKIPGDTRIVTATVKGELLVHGHKVDRQVPVEVTFKFAPGAKPEAKPTSIDVKTKEPLKVVLAEHEVKPRDDLGKIAKASFGLLGTKVAETANVTFDFHATPSP